MVNGINEIKIEHVLILAIIVFVLYHLISRCECANVVDGFSVGIENSYTSASCISKLNTLCSDAKKRGFTYCQECGGEGEHANLLHEAGCSNSDIQNFCSLPRCNTNDTGFYYDPTCNIEDGGKLQRYTYRNGKYYNCQSGKQECFPTEYQLIPKCHPKELLPPEDCSSIDGWTRPCKDYYQVDYREEKTNCISHPKHDGCDNLKDTGIRDSRSPDNPPEGNYHVRNNCYD